MAGVGFQMAKLPASKVKSYFKALKESCSTSTTLTPTWSAPFKKPKKSPRHERVKFKSKFCEPGEAQKQKILSAAKSLAESLPETSRAGAVNILASISHSNESGGSEAWKLREMLFDAGEKSLSERKGAFWMGVATMIAAAIYPALKYTQSGPDPSTLEGKIVYGLLAIGAAMGAVSGIIYSAKGFFLTNRKANQQAREKVLELMGNASDGLGSETFPVSGADGADRGLTG